MNTQKKVNKYGCSPSGDVCLKHDSPLISYGFCEDSPEIKELILDVEQSAYNKAIEIILKINFLGLEEPAQIIGKALSDLNKLKNK